MITDYKQATNKIIENNDVESVLLIQKVFEHLNITQEFITSFCKFKKLDFYGMFFTIITWMSQGTQNISSLFCAQHKAMLNLTFCRSSLYKTLASTKADWFGLAHSIMMSVARMLLTLDPTGANSYLIIDDTNIQRDRAKKVELSNKKLHDHNNNTYHNGFCLIQIGLSVLNHFVPIAFKLAGTSNEKNQAPERCKIDKRTKASKLRNDTSKAKPDLVLEMLKQLKNNGLAGFTILCDSWFTCPKFIKNLDKMGYKVIGMLKEGSTKYMLSSGEYITVKAVASKIKQAIAEQNKQFGEIAMSFTVYIPREDGSYIEGRIIFAKNWRKDHTAKGTPYIPIFTTRLDLTDEALRQAYRKRWNIEQGFRILKSWFGLIAGNSSQLFETNIALVSLSHMRYALLVACHAILFPNKRLNQVRKMLVQESIYQNLIIEVAKHSKEVAQTIKTSIEQTLEGIQKDLNKIIDGVTLQRVKELSLIKSKIIDSIDKRINLFNFSMLRCLYRIFSNETPLMEMLTNLLLRGNITLANGNIVLKL